MYWREPLSTIQSLCLLLIAAHLLGVMARRAGLPEILGQIVAGAALGPAGLRWVAPDASLGGASDLALLFVVIASGLELQLASVLRVYRGGGIAKPLPGLLLPAAAGVLLGRAAGIDWPGTTVIGLSLAVTALPVALRILSSYGLQSTRLARIAIACALLDDVLVLLVLGVLPAAAGADAPAASLLGMAMLRLCGLLGLVAVSGWLCRRWTWRQGVAQQPVAAQKLPALILILLMAGASEALRLHFAIGAFLGALTVSRYGGSADDRHVLHSPADTLTSLLFAPLFLASQGLHMAPVDLSQLGFIAALTAAAVASKLVGGYWCGRLFGLGRHDARGVAIILNARGVMATVAAAIALRSGLIEARLYTSLLSTALLATVITLLLMRSWRSKLDGAVAGSVLNQHEHGDRQSDQADRRHPRRDEHVADHH